MSHDVTWARTDLPGTGDLALLDIAEADNRVLLTLDKDFWQIAIQRPQLLERRGVIRPHGHGEHQLRAVEFRRVAPDRLPQTLLVGTVARGLFPED